MGGMCENSAEALSQRTSHGQLDIGVELRVQFCRYVGDELELIIYLVVFATVGVVFVDDGA